MKAEMVVPTGLEPVTSPMSRERATNCAKGRMWVLNNIMDDHTKRMLALQESTEKFCTKRRSIYAKCHRPRLEAF